MLNYLVVWAGEEKGYSSLRVRRNFYFVKVPLKKSVFSLKVYIYVSLLDDLCFLLDII